MIGVREANKNNENIFILCYQGTSIIVTTLRIMFLSYKTM